MDLLKRELAPVLPSAWEQIDDEARTIFKTHLAGRKVVDFDGPHGWKHGAHNTGKMDLFDKQPVAGVHAGLRLVRPLVELRVPIVLDQMDLDSAGRGATPDLEPVAQAAKRIAQAEDAAIFNGWKDAGIDGILDSSTHKPVDLPKTADGYAAAVVEASSRLHEAGIDGPYSLVLGTKPYMELLRGVSEGGYPVRKMIEGQIIDGTITHAPSIKGGVVLSTRGDDFVLHVGQDLSIGYAGHDKEQVELYLTESFTFSVFEPDAAVCLRAR